MRDTSLMEKAKEKYISRAKQLKTFGLDDLEFEAEIEKGVTLTVESEFATLKVDRILKNEKINFSWASGNDVELYALGFENVEIPDGGCIYGYTHNLEDIQLQINNITDMCVMNAKPIWKLTETGDTDCYMTVWDEYKIDWDAIYKYSPWEVTLVPGIKPGKLGLVSAAKKYAESKITVLYGKEKITLGDDIGALLIKDNGIIKLGMGTTSSARYEAGKKYCNGFITLNRGNPNLYKVKALLGEPTIGIHGDLVWGYRSSKKYGLIRDTEVEEDAII